MSFIVTDYHSQNKKGLRQSLLTEEKEMQIADIKLRVEES